MNCRSWWCGNVLRRPGEAAKGGGRGILQAEYNACAWRGCGRSIWTRQAMYVQRKFAARSPMLIPSRLFLTAWRHFCRTEHFYKRFNVAGNNRIYSGLHVKWRLFFFCPISTNFGVSQQISTKVLNMKFNRNPSNKNCDATCGQTDGHDEGNMHFSRLLERA